MRLRFAVLASVLAALTVGSVVSVNAVAKAHRAVTINATPNPASAGNGVLVYGQLNGSNSGGKVVRLFERVNPRGGFFPAGHTKTSPQGFYSFQKVVLSNREWYVAGPGGVRSRVLRERVSALISLTASTTSTDTKHPVTFSGHVEPNHTGERVYLQEQKSGTNSDEWHTLKSAVIGPGSNYSITHRFVFPAQRDVRVLLREDARNIKSASDPVTVTIQQAQVPGFSISNSAPIIPEGSGATISGVLDKSATGNVPDPNVSVTLWGRTADQSQFTPIGSTTTGTDGSYKFDVHPTVNTVYEVRTTFAPARHTAALFEGVRDVVTMSANPTTSPVGGKVMFTGTVSPDKAGRLIFLQMLGSDGDWHNVEFTHVTPSSTFAFVYRPATTGTERFRARITSDEHNIGGASAPVPVTVTGVTPISSLPTTP